MDEIWKPYPEFPAFFEVSTHGRVRSVGRKTTAWNNRSMQSTVFTSHKNTWGYIGYTLSVNGRKYSRSGHRMVMETFVGPRRSWQMCNHKDGDKTNNRLENLEWCSASDNSLHAKHVLRKQIRDSPECSSYQKMTCAQVAEAVQMCRDGLPYQEIANKYGVSKQTIYRFAKADGIARKPGRKPRTTSDPRSES